MKNKKIVFLGSLLSSMLFSSNSFADIPITRQTHDFLRLIDNQGVVSATVNRMATSGAGIQSLSTEPVPNALYRGGSPISRPNCGFDSSRNWSSEALVINAFRDCFTNSVYNQVQRDLAHLIQNTTARSGYYSYTNPARINGEDRFVQIGVFLRANQSHTEARRLGINISRSENASSIYAIYEHPRGLEPIGNRMNNMINNPGELRIYLMPESDPDRRDRMEFLRSYRDDRYNIDYSKTTETDEEDIVVYDKNGVLNVMDTLSNYIDEYSSIFTVLDYGNPLSPSLVLDELESDPECLSGDLDTNTSCSLKNDIRIETPERFYARDQCKIEDNEITILSPPEVMYGQRNITQLGVDYRRDRYIIEGPSDVIDNASIVKRTYSIEGEEFVREEIVTSSRLGSIRVMEEVGHEYLFLSDFQLETEHVHIHDYPSDVSFSSFLNRISDPYNEKSSSPDNRFIIGDYDIFNDYPPEVYGDVSELIDDSLMLVEYDIYEIKEEGYFTTRSRERTVTNETCVDVIQKNDDDEIIEDDDGNPVTVKECTTTTSTVTDTESGTYYDTSDEWTYTNWVPPVYSKETHSACIHNTQEENFCETYNCDQTTPSYDPDGYITDKSLDENIQEDFYWSTGDWSECGNNCGIGTQSRTVTCVSTVTGETVGPANCSGDRPMTERSCPGNVENCSFEWFIGDWSVCSEVCDGGTRTREVYCSAPDGSKVSDSRCTGTKPSESGVCNTETCVYSYNTSGWSSCQSNSSCIRTTTSSRCSWYGKDNYRCYSVRTTDDSSARSRGWLNNQMTTIGGQRNDGFNGSHFQCTSRSTSTCYRTVGWGKEAYSVRGTRTSIITHGQQTRSVSCVRENDNAKVHIGFCGPNQPKTHKICTRSVMIGGCT